MQQLKNDLTSKLSALATAQTILADKKSAVTTAEEELAQAHQAVTDAQQTYTYAELIKKTTDDDVIKAETLLNELQTADPQDAAAIASQQAIVVVLQQDANTADSDLTTAKTALDTAKDQSSIKEQTATDAKQEVTSAESGVSQAEAAVSAAQSAITSKQAEITQLIVQLDKNTYGNITALKSQTDVDEATAVINAEYDVIKIKLDAAKNTRDTLKTLADAVQLTADQTLAAANASGISTDGDLTLILKNGGSVGERANALGVTVDGDLDIHAGTDKALDNVYLESGSNLDLDQLIAGGEVVINTQGNIEAADQVSGVVITASNAVLNSLSGNIGSGSSPLHTSVDSVTAIGKNVYLNNNKSLEVDTIIGDTVKLNVSGDITSGNAGTTTGNNDVISGDLNMNADGNIGVSGGALIVAADKFSSSSRNMTVQSGDSIIIGSINTQNSSNISAGGIISAAQAGSNAITAGNLNMNSAGNIGTAVEPLNIYVPGAVQSNADYGDVYLVNTYKDKKPGSGGGNGGAGGGNDEITMRDKATGILVTGEITGELVVTDIKVDLQDGSVVSQLIEKLGLKQVLAAYDIQITGDISGTVSVTIPVGNQYNGKKLTVLYEQNGRTTVANVTVVNGSISIEAENPGAFIILDNIYPINIITLGSSAFADVVQTDWFFEGVAYVYSMNLMKGIADKEFAPHETLTRSMLAVILFRLEGETGMEAIDGSVPETWYEDGMNWAISSGIIMNDEPGDQITREQFVLMLYRYAGFKGWNVNSDFDISAFDDANNVSDYAADAMRWAVAAGLVRGRGDNDLAPDANLTRADTAVMLKRLTDIFPTGRLLIQED